ncbi:MAG: hypothetical protein LBU55_03090 [Elusimicrobiota bacterium]|jgi:hypothetical protein|nr:hypothetical protein [Elusimicrobiota bacterium]
MNSCINCLFKADDKVDNIGNAKIFCLVNKTWKIENAICKHFTEYADLSKEIRSKYAFEIRMSKKSAVSQSWKAMIVTLIVSFIMFVLSVKFFDKYIF